MRPSEVATANILFRQRCETLTKQKGFCLGQQITEWTKCVCFYGFLGLDVPFSGHKVASYLGVDRPSSHGRVMSHSQGNKGRSEPSSCTDCFQSDLNSKGSICQSSLLAGNLLWTHWLLNTAEYGWRWIRLKLSEQRKGGWPGGWGGRQGPGAV